MKKLLIIVLVTLAWQSSWICAADDLQKSDKEFLEMVAKKTFLFFWNEANPDNGLIPDATRNRNCSISVTGFGLAAICIADARGWITREEAYERVLTTLRCFVDYPGNPSRTKVQEEHGHHYHWVNINTGKWIGEEGIFASDTGAFIAGVLAAGEYFKGTEVETLADKIYKNVDWAWFQNKENNTVYIGWTPGAGHGGEYSMGEIGAFITLMGVGSPTYPIPVECWYNLGNRYYYAKYGDYSYVGDGAAYTHQWSFCFMDPRLKKDYFLDYFQNVREFSLASRQWCMDHKNEGYSDRVWGLNVAQGPDKYGDYAAPVIPGSVLPYNGKDNDGTVAPTAAIGNIPFTPRESLEAAKYMYEMYGNKIFLKYGFTDTFNVRKNFWSDVYLGIDQGPIIIGIDNYLYGTVWKSFMNNKHIKKAMDAVGFVGVIDNFDESRHSEPYAQWFSEGDGVKFFKDDSQYKEGRHSLRVEPGKTSAEKSFYAEPLLNDFSRYKYLSFWKSGEGEVRVFVEDANRKNAELKLASKSNDNIWELHYYNCAGLGVDLKNVKKVLFKITSHNRAEKNDLHFDFIHLTNRRLAEAPPAPYEFAARTGENGGEIDLSWKMQYPKNSGTDIASWKVKVSETPIKNKGDFARAKDVMTEYFPFYTYKAGNLTLSNLISGKKYYIGSAVENRAYNTSEIVFAEAAANAKEEVPFGFGKKELVDFDLSEWYEFSSTGDKLRLSKQKGMEGHALELDYDTTASGIDYHWMGVGKKISGKLPAKCRFSFYLKGGTADLNMEFKLCDKNGSVFGKKMENVASKDKWKKVVVDSSELTHWWGGTGSKAMGLLKSIEIVFATNRRAQGAIAVNKLEME